jgi:hypothetical protein
VAGPVLGCLGRFSIAVVGFDRHAALNQESKMTDPKDPKMSGRVAMIALIVAFAVVGLMLWVGQ